MLFYPVLFWWGVRIFWNMYSPQQWKLWNPLLGIAERGIKWARSGSDAKISAIFVEFHFSGQNLYKSRWFWEFWLYESEKWICKEPGGSLKQKIVAKQFLYSWMLEHFLLARVERFFDPLFCSNPCFQTW